MIVEPSEVDVDARRARDRELVESHCNGDPDAFASIIADHYRVLLAQAERRVRSHGEAEDVVQDTFERAFRAICRFGTDDEYRLGAWLSRILANVCTDREGRLARERGIPERLAVQAVDGTEGFDSVSDPVVLRAVHDAIDALPSSQRDTFLLKERDGLSYPQLADRLEITEESARARVHRARTALQRSLALTRAALGGLVAIPVGLRTVLRRARPVPAPVPTGAEAASGGGATSMAVQLAVSPVGQAVATIVPTGAVRGSAIAALAGIAVTGVIGLPMVADPSSSSSPVTAAVAEATSATASLVPADPSELVPPTSPAPVAVAVDSKTSKDSTAADVIAKLQSTAWWLELPLFLGASVDDREGMEPGVVGVPSAGDVDPSACAAPGGAPEVTTQLVTAVVSQVNLAPVAVTGSVGEGSLAFETAAKLGGSSEELAVTATTCGSPFPGAIDVTLSNGGNAVRLLGALVYGDGDSGTYVFRGNASSNGDTMPWGTQATFMARLVITAGPHATAQLSIVFYADADAAPVKQGDPRDIVVPPPSKSLDDDNPPPPTSTTLPGSQGPDAGDGNTPSTPTTSVPQVPPPTGDDTND